MDGRGFGFSRSFVKRGLARLRLLGARQKPLVLRGTVRHAAPAAAAKGTRGACDACLMPALRGPPRQQVEPGPARPLPLQTRSRGSVLRGMHSWQASFGGCWETGWFQLNHEIGRLQLPQAKRRQSAERRSDCQKTQESSRGPQPFRPGSARLHLLPLFHKKGSANIQRGHGTVFASENPIFQRKKRFLAGSALEQSSIFSGDWRGWQWRGSLHPRPPACQNFYDKLSAERRFRSVG